MPSGLPRCWGWLLLLAFGWWLASAPRPAQAAAFDVRFDVPSLSLARHVGVALDVPVEFQLKDLQADPGRFAAWARDDVNLGIRRLPTWLKLEVRNPGNRPVTWVLDVGDGLVEWMTLHEVSAHGVVRQRTTGTTLPWATREPPGHRFTFTLEEPPGSTRTLFLEIRSGFSQRLTMKAHTPDAHQEKMRDQWLGHGLYFGALAGLAAYHLVLFLLLRDPAFILYCGLLVTALCSRALFWGFGVQSIWPEGSAVSVSWHGLPFGLGHVLGIAFTLKVMDVRRHAPWLRQPMRLLGAVYGVALVAGFWMPSWLNVMVVYLGAVTIQIAMMAVGGLGWWRGDATGRWFVPAWGVLILGVNIWILSNLGILPGADWMIWAAPVSVSVNAVLLAAALAARVRASERAQLALQCQRGLEQEAANRALEQRVSARTEELHAAKERAEQAGVIKDLFVRLVSHDLRSPLASIIAAAERIDGVGRPLAAGIRQTAAGLIRLIDRLLDLDVLSTGRMVLQRSYVPMRQLAEPPLQALQALAQSRRVTLCNELPADGTVFGDPTLLGQVLGNLLGNAVKFGRPGDVVTLAVDTDGRSLVVHDTGPGFAATRTAPTPSANPPSTPPATLDAPPSERGLGLRVSGEIMLAHGGRLEIDERVASGARVVMRLPPRGAVVLLADDQPTQRALMAEWVREALPQATVVDAEDGQQAWDRLEAVRPDLLVADVQMPRRDGLDLVRALRADMRWQHLPVLMVSAADRDARGRPMRLACLEAGADDFLAKPLAPEAFATLLKTLMHPPDEMVDNDAASVRPSDGQGPPL